MKQIYVLAMVTFLFAVPIFGHDTQPIKYGTLYAWSWGDTFTMRITRLEDRSLYVGVTHLSNGVMFTLNAYSLDGFRVDWIQTKTEVRRFTFYRGDALRRYVYHLSGRQMPAVSRDEIGVRDKRGRFVKNSDPRIQEMFDYIEMILRDWRMAEEEHFSWVDRSATIASAALIYPPEWEE